MGKLLDGVKDQLRFQNLFPNRPIIYFVPQIKQCPDCGHHLSVYYSDTRDVVTLRHGIFTAHYTVLHCQACGNNDTYKTEGLAQIVPKFGRFGYDVIEYIGRATFLGYRTQQEVVDQLRGYNINISGSEVGYLARKFILYLNIVHKQSSGEIKIHINTNGGYILHVDGTSQGGSPHLISTMDQISQFVLSNIKIPTEKADDISPLLQKLKRTFGNPLAIVTDMGKAMLKSVSKVFFGIMHFICHFHFLRDIGKDLLEQPYRQIRNGLKKHAISKQLLYLKKQYALKSDFKICPEILHQIPKIRKSRCE